MGEMSIPVMLRKARKAVTGGNYEEAALLYTSLMGREEMADNLDIQVRHAYCVEKTGHTNQAIALYKGIVEHYRGLGETGAADSVEETVKQLENAVEEQRAAARAEAAEKARVAKEAAEKARLQKEREEKLRLQKEREEKIRLEKEREEKIRLEKERKEQEAREKILAEERARAELIRKKKAEAEKARAERFKTKKSKPVATHSFLDTIQTEAFNASSVDQDDEEEVLEFDLSDEEGIEPENKPWLG